MANEAKPPTDLPEMEYRFVGRSGLQVSAISLGGWLTYGGHIGDGRSPFVEQRAGKSEGITGEFFLPLVSSWQTHINHIHPST